MKKTKIDWCDCTVNPVVGCPNNCEYCYGCAINKRFKLVADWSKPEFFPERLKQFNSKKSKSVFIDSMSDIGTWEQGWFDAVCKAMNSNPQHRYIALTKCIGRFYDKINRTNTGLLMAPLYIGTSITTQAQASKFYIAGYQVDFLSIEPLLEPVDLWLILKNNMTRCVIIGAETGTRKNKVVPLQSWVDNIVADCDKYDIAIFMKESLRSIMGNKFRQDKLPWEK